MVRPGTRPGEMTIGIVGAGRIAQSLGHLLNSRGATVKGVASRTLASAEAAASFIGSPARPSTLPQLLAETDHLILCVSDSALPAIAEQLGRGDFSGGCVLHTSGGAGLAGFKSLSELGVAVGVLHPLQTVPTPEDGVADLPGSYFAIGGDAPALRWARSNRYLLDGRAFG